MTLNEFLTALQTENIIIVIKDDQNNDIIRFYSEGFEGIESDILAKNVVKFFVSQGMLTVILESDEEPEPEPEPTPDTNETDDTTPETSETTDNP